ncbi:hypothetical protein M378DRAFT_120851 [Amanita muscaria Koide BX008]|uniref:Uncharacterized protein n=1 Tax=Amanita muscaria (strain Koide BX008) TaxID=946122 RepID=A0A0C2SYL2_AMAMK|nr:hypothetical protein M378DRAFT_120851 [Amanita muscaria Koide BX008]
MERQEQPPAQPSEQTQHPVRDGPSVRELRKNAYRGGDTRGDFGGRKGQPDMKLRMNALLAKIKRDHQN